MIKVEKGTLPMGSNGGKEDKVDGFYINKYKVTNKQYGEFVKNTGYKIRGEWNENHPVDESYHPVVNITYKDAAEYCRNLGKRLPKTTEWEFTCRGDNVNNYPWGNIFKRHMANVNGYCGGTTVVGSFSSRELGFGIMVSGMFGNVMEWTEGQVLGATGMLNVVRGQSHKNNIKIYDCRTPLRVPAEGNFNSSKIGFRCAR